jgi:hypothetical protein
MSTSIYIYIYIKKKKEEEERRCEMQFKKEPRKATLGRKIKQIRSQDRSPHLREDKIIIELLA